MKSIQQILFLLVAGLLAASTATAAVNINTVLVGDAGNTANTAIGAGAIGGVGYEYRIGTYEVTNSEYTAFLNATAKTDPHGLYHTEMGTSSYGGIDRTGTAGNYTYSVKNGAGNKPVNYVSFFDAARFTNWLTTGNTETGVYALNGGNPTDVTRNITAWNGGGVAIASQDEWHKAAYYKGGGINAGYWAYANQSDSITTNDANYRANGIYSSRDVGSYNSTSAYGTYDQNGNLAEIQDTLVTDHRRMHGGSAITEADDVTMTSAEVSRSVTQSQENSLLGFRVSSLNPIIPEPSTYAAILGCLGLLLALMRRKGRGTL